MNIYAFVTIAAAFKLLPSVAADRWYVNWLDLECVSDKDKPFWSAVYGSREVSSVQMFIDLLHINAHTCSLTGMLYEGILVEGRLRGY